MISSMSDFWEGEKMGTTIMQSDHELSDGGVIEVPDNDGTIRRRDVHGNCEEVRTIDDDDWSEWAQLFGMTKKNFEGEAYSDEHVHVSRDTHEDGE